MPAADAGADVRAQCDGDREIPGVAPDSRASTSPEPGARSDQLVAKLDPSTGVRLLLQAEHGDPAEAGDRLVARHGRRHGPWATP